MRARDALEHAVHLTTVHRPFDTRTKSTALLPSNAIRAFAPGLGV